MVRYSADVHGFDGVLRGADMADVMREVGEAGARHAASIAPVGPDEGGHYRDKFEVSVQLEGDRQTATLGNSADYAAAVEWGLGTGVGHMVLTRAADWIEAGPL